MIYPLLPNEFIDPWKLINPRESWITVVVIGAIGFINYVLLRIYSNRGMIYTAVLGGLVNSTATIAELASWLRDPAPETVRMGTFFNFVTLVAMFARNLFLLAIFARQAVPVAVLPLGAMSCCAAAFVWFSRGSSRGRGRAEIIVAGIHSQAHIVRSAIPVDRNRQRHRQAVLRSFRSGERLV